MVALTAVQWVERKVSQKVVRRVEQWAETAAKKLVQQWVGY
jgi:hypothetical protein